jgi:hypothetical protein
MYYGLWWNASKFDSEVQPISGFRGKKWKKGGAENLESLMLNISAPYALWNVKPDAFGKTKCERHDMEELIAAYISDGDDHGDHYGNESDGNSSDYGHQDRLLRASYQHYGYEDDVSMLVGSSVRGSAAFLRSLAEGGGILRLSRVEYTNFKA